MILRCALLLLLPLAIGCVATPPAEPARTEPIQSATAELQDFVRSGWHLPVAVEVFFSAPAQELSDAQRAREEQLTVRQLAAVRRAYARSPFDLFAVRLRFLPGDAHVRFEPEALRLEIRLPPPRDAGDASLSADALLAAQAEDYGWERELRWYEGERRADVEAALRRDLVKLGRLERNLAQECHRLEMLAASLQVQGTDPGKQALTPSETEFARAAQFRATFALHRVLNTLGRWGAAVEDPGFPCGPEVLAALVYAHHIHDAYLDWLLDVIVGGRAVVRIWDDSWWHRNPLYRTLDAPAPLVALDGRELGQLPPGAVRGLLDLRRDGDLHDWFEELDERWEKAPTRAEGSPLAAELRPVLARIPAVRSLAAEKRLSSFTAWKEHWDARIKGTVVYPFYEAVAAISRFLGDTRVGHPEPAVSSAQLAELERTLRPGDVILVRQELYLSNAFLPGFWSHAILYLGPADAWRDLKLPDGTPLGEDPVAQRVLRRYDEPVDGGPPRVIEAISEGVVLSSLEHAVRKDCVAVLRPLLDEPALAAGLRRALALHGRPYDFDFDFASDDKIVCTELIYRAFNAELNFRVRVDAKHDPPPEVPGLLSIMGRLTLPAQELARYALYMEEQPEPHPAFNYPGRRLRLVCLLDGQPETLAERLEGPAALPRFRDTLSR